MNPSVAIYRLGHALLKLRVPLVPKLLSYFNRLVFGCWVPSTAVIGKSFKLGYWGVGIVIHNNARIGDNCLISQNVTIARNKKEVGAPQLGDNVYVAAGAVIVGNIIIGDNVIIGANSFVNKDIPSGVVAAGVPARVLRSLQEHELDDILGG